MWLSAINSSWWFRFCPLGKVVYSQSAFAPWNIHKRKEHASRPPLQSVDTGPDTAACVCVMCVTLLVAWVRSSCVNHKLTPQHETGVTLRTVHRGTLIKNTHILLVFTNTNAGEWTWGSVTDWVHHEEEDHSFQEWGKKKGILMNVTLTWLLGPPLFAHMPIWHSITLRARPRNSFTQSNSKNKGAVKAPFHLKRRGGEEPGVPAVASRVISPRKASTLERFKSPD